MLREFHLTQTQREPTRGDRVLDLHITSCPTLVKTTTVVLGISNHDGAIVVDSTQSPVINRKSPRKVFVFSKVRWLKKKDDVQNWSQGFIRALYDHTVEDNWKKLKSHLNDTMATNIPTKMTSTKWYETLVDSWHLPWVQKKTPALQEIQEDRNYCRSGGLPVSKERDIQVGQACEGETHQHLYCRKTHGRWYQAILEVPEDPQARLHRPAAT